MYGYLIVNGIIFLIMGGRALLKPVEAVAIPYGLIAEEVDAKNYLRSAAGGVAIAAGITQILGVLFPKFAVAALIMVLTILGGLVSGRLFSLLRDGKPGALPWISGFFETLGLAFGSYWLIDALG